MFGISEKLIVGRSDGIFGVSPINWEDSSWKQLSLVYDAWEQQLDWFKSSSQYRALDRIDGEAMKFEWNIFPGFTTLQLVDEVQEFMNKMSKPEQFQGRIIFMSMFNDIILRINDNERECIANATLVPFFLQQDYQQDVGHSSDLDQKQSGIPLTTKDHKENGTESLN